MARQLGAPSGTSSWIDCTIGTATLLLHLLLFTTDVAHSVKIVHHSISHTVDGGNNSASIVLDCDYIYDPGDIKLVVRWFYNDSPEPIYQWIPSSDARYVGELIRGHFDLDYKVSDDRFTKYRAIRLIPQKIGNVSYHLPINLAGKYTCVIASISSQDSRHGQLVIFVPPNKFEFNLLAADEVKPRPSEATPNSEGPLLRCTVENVYPKPLLTYSELPTGNGIPVPPPASMQPHVHMVEVAMMQNESTGLYSAGFEYRLPVEAIKVGTVYECKLELPSASYVRKKRIKLIYPSTYLHPDGSNGYYDQDWPSWLKPGRGSRLPPGAKSELQAQLNKRLHANQCQRLAAGWTLLLGCLLVAHWCRSALVCAS